MKSARNIKRAARWAGLALLCAGVMGAGCLEDRGVQVVAGTNLEACLEARGSDNTYGGIVEVDLLSAGEVEDILEENGIDPPYIAQIESGFFMVTKPETGRVVSGTITVGDGLGEAHPLITYAAIPVDDPEYLDWSGVPLQQDGVEYVNALLLAYFQAIENGDPDPPVPTVTFVVDGTSTPVDVATDFDYCVRLKFTVVGSTEIEVFDPL